MIDNEEEFHVARRLIGAKGCNMKRIIELCNKGVYKAKVRSQDIVKLRLRGKGSGLKEDEESVESLHLVVTSKYYDKYQIACNHVQELILNVYEEYKVFCAKQGLTNLDFDLQIKKLESLSRQSSSTQGPPKVH